jgi:hypothetical protein
MIIDTDRFQYFLDKDKDIWLFPIGKPIDTEITHGCVEISLKGVENAISVWKLLHNRETGKSELTGREVARAYGPLIPATEVDIFMLFL